MHSPCEDGIRTVSEAKGAYKKSPPLGERVGGGGGKTGGGTHIAGPDGGGNEREREEKQED